MKEIIIVGAGAAGMMAAISASGQKNEKRGKDKVRVTIIEKNDRPGKKIYITGKGRCNISNSCPPEDFLSSVVTNPRFLYSSFAGWNNEDMIRFLNEQGLETKEERGRRIFPVSDHSSDVIRTLRKACQDRGVHFLFDQEAEEILFDPSGKCVTGLKLSDGRELHCDSLILACGGCSYPSTGSDGSGWRIAAGAGHKIKAPQPSLVPFVMEETWCRDLMGLTLKNVSLTLKTGKKTIYEGFGEMLFTHFGISGPLVLTASTCLGKYQKQLKEGKIRCIIHFKPALSQEVLDQRLLREFDTWRKKNISSVTEQLLPKKLVPVFLDYCDIASNKKVRDITKKERIRMREALHSFEMRLKATRGFGEAIVTRGGVDVRGVNPSTMESKLVKGLYFAGEMLDVDAVTGGFNLQIAWSTGHAAGEAAARALTEEKSLENHS